MASDRTSTRGATRAEETPAPGPAPTGAPSVTGWARFGAVVMAVVGGFAIVEGLVAILSPVYFVATSAGVLALSVGGWGWVHLILGILVLSTGISLLRDAPGWARETAVVLIALHMIVQLAWLPAYPIWSIILLVLDVLVLHALLVMRPDRRD